jgi:selenide, water dikinase
LAGGLVRRQPAIHRRHPIERGFLASRVRWPTHLPAARQTLLCDAQTSGGLLMAVPGKDVEPLLKALEGKRVAGSVVGELTEGEAGSILVV